ncbi:hypothetical protein [Caulobacter sp. NIBR1757]|uniref:hypothetical protein n=1 Tax=Caulobacter sp. NIBR1757 TaxID=3016000 RepID=UPI0022F0B3FF|nr:hypothetical protein [Caulobacter sp. NIBR1757]WGM39763.1 hypothetical protein AMEJIAPC_02690 [Caulobacter sp. NIBR1757]
MSDGAAERPFYERGRARSAGALAAGDSRRLFLALNAAAALIAAVVIYSVGFLGGGIIGADLASKVVYLIGYASLPVVGVALLLAVVVTVGLAFTPRRKERRRGWFDDFGPLFLAGLLGGGLALAVIIGPSLREAEIQVAITAALDGHHRRVNADNKALDKELRLSVNREGLLFYPGRLARDTGYRQSIRIIAEHRALFARYRERSDARFAESRLALAEHARGKSWRDRALSEWDRRIAEERGVADMFYDSEDALLDSAEGLIRRLKSSPGEWRGVAYYFDRPADLAAFDADIRRHRERETEASQQARAMGLTNFEAINNPMAAVER